MKQGGCHCDAVRYEVEGPYPTTHCHCLHCRKLSGAPFITWIEVKASGFRFTQGEPVRFEVRDGVERSFCGACGSPLTYQNRALGDSIDLTAGTLDDPSDLEPRDHVWFERHLSWADVGPDLPRFQRGRRDA